MNPAAPEHEPLDYGGHEETRKVILDCSLGVNPAGPEEAVAEAAAGCGHDALRALIGEYPHDDSVKEALAAWFQSQRPGREWLTGSSFVMGNGSYGILCALNELFLGPGRKVLGCGPQFTAYIDSAVYSGAAYDAVLLKAESGYRFDGEAYRKAMTAEYDLFILENPNNPTGQAVAPDEIAKIADKARELKRVLVVDEAYADYLSPYETAVDLLPAHDNIIVTRSFSKGFGMAGIRLGYAVTAPGSGIADALEKAALPFQCNNFARYLAKAALKAKTGKDDPFGAEKNRRMKEVLKECLDAQAPDAGRRLSMAETSPAVPIFMLYAEDKESPAGSGNENTDLYELFMEEGILTVSCGTYPGLGKHAVRLMLPSEEKFPVLLDAVKSVAAKPG